MKSNKYKILVLSDLKERAEHTLSYAAKLSNEIDADIEFFHAKEATEIMQLDNPLAVMDVISEISNKAEKKIKELVTPISVENNIYIKTDFAYGHVKNAILNCIKTSQPNMIILGERKQKRFNFFGDHIKHFVNKNYNGLVLEVTNDNTIDSKGKVSLDNIGLKDNLDNYNIKTKDKVSV